MSASSAITWGVRADLVCLLCGRVAGTITLSAPRIVQVKHPEHTEAVKRWRCPICGGRLFPEHAENVVVGRRTLTPAEMNPTPGPRRGRRPKQTGPGTPHRESQRAYRERLAAGLVVHQRWARGFDSCTECGLTTSRHNAHGQCNRCKNRAARQQRAVS